MSKNLNTLKQDFRFGVISQEDYDRARADRNTAWAALSASEQLADLDARLGVGVGATRQRAMIADKLIVKLAVALPPSPRAEDVMPAVPVKKKKFKKGNKK